MISYFFVFSIGGYIIEVILCSIGQKKFVNRGFLFGPWLPIYGFGGLLIIALTSPIRDNFLLTFVISMAIGAVIEYVSSFLLEKIFHVHWWDYSLTDKYNLNGRICIRNTLAFGIGGCILVYSAFPLISSILNHLSVGWEIGVAIVLSLIFIFDLVVSSYANSKVKYLADFNKVVGDQTNEIKKNAKQAIKMLFSTPEKLARKIEKAKKKAEQKLVRAEKKKSRKKK